MNTIDSTSKRLLIPVIRPAKRTHSIPTKNAHEQAAEHARLREMFKNTTPLGREVIRKKLFKLKGELLIEARQRQIDAATEEVKKQSQLGRSITLDEILDPESPDTIGSEAFCRKFKCPMPHI